MNEAIRKSIEGGWKWMSEGYDMTEWVGDKYEGPSDSEIREDPLFWQCLGKALGWKTYTWSSYKSYSNLSYNEETDDESWSPKTEYAERHITYVLYWHRFIDHIAEGKDVDDFFKELLTQQKEV